MNKLADCLAALVLVMLLSGSALAQYPGGYRNWGGPGMMGPGMMGPGMMGPGMMGPGMMGPGMMGPGMMGPGSIAGLSDAQIDQIGEHIVRMHNSMEAILKAPDAIARREAVRKHLQTVQALMWQRHQQVMQGFQHRYNQWQEQMRERMGNPAQ